MLKHVLLFSFFIYSTLCYEIEEIKLPPLVLPDSPYWDNKTQSLYFVDHFSVNATICRYAYNPGLVICTTIEGETEPSFITPLKCCKDLFAIGLGHTVKIVHWSGTTEIATVVGSVFSVESGTTSQMDRGFADPKGRLYAGTFNKTLCGGSPTYGFYRYSHKKKHVKKFFGNVHTTTGITLDRHAKKLYHLDGCHAIVGFDWDPKTGNLCNARNAFNYNLGSNIPTYVLVGLTVDTNGFLYTGVVGASMIWVIDPRTSIVVDGIKMPTEVITTPTFGGPNLDQLFVASGSQNFDFATGQPNNQTLTSSAGSLFRIIGYGSRGYPASRMRL